MAGWKSGSGMGLPVSQNVYVCQIADVKSDKGKDFKDKTIEVDRFNWTVDVWVGNQWARKTVFTGVDFADPAKISGPQFTPKLMKLVRACGKPLPATPSEAMAWDANSLIGARFGIRVNDEEGEVQEKFVRLETAAPAAPVATAPVAPPPAAPAQPVAAAAATQAPAPPPTSVTVAPSGESSGDAAVSGTPPDPFVAPDAGGVPVGAGVAGAVDPWASG